MSNYEIITASSAEELARRVNKILMNGAWEVDGSHKVVETHRQNRYRGDQLVDTIITREYSQTIKNVI